MSRPDGNAKPSFFRPFFLGRHFDRLDKRQLLGDAMLLVGGCPLFEAIHDIRQAGWVETKLTPLRLRFVTENGSSWSLAYLLNHKRSHPAERWRREHVIVVAVAVDLRRRSS